MIRQIKRYGTTPILTFDQPLWWKAITIVENEPEGSDLKKFVLRIGVFHLQMSFLGSIGHLMAGSGLEEVLELVYAKNAVTHMLTGKAYSRAVRGHLLADSALNALLASKAYNITLPSKRDDNASEVSQPSFFHDEVCPVNNFHPHLTIFLSYCIAAHCIYILFLRSQLSQLKTTFK